MATYADVAHPVSISDVVPVSLAESPNQSPDHERKVDNYTMAIK